jgi:hypothetical protein
VFPRGRDKKFSVINPAGFKLRPQFFFVALAAGVMAYLTLL